MKRILAAAAVILILFSIVETGETEKNKEADIRESAPVEQPAAETKSGTDLSPASYIDRSTENITVYTFETETDVFITWWTEDSNGELIKTGSMNAEYKVSDDTVRFIFENDPPWEADIEVRDDYIILNGVSLHRTNMKVHDL